MDFEIAKLSTLSGLFLKRRARKQDLVDDVSPAYRQRLTAVASIVLLARPEYQGTRAGFADENYLTSGNCRSCHADHYASWARTYHSRMTQEATPANVQGDFTRNNSFEYLGVKARMEKRDGGFFMILNLPDGTSQTAKIDRIVGSRRIMKATPVSESGWCRHSALLLIFGVVAFALAARGRNRERN